MMYHKFFACFVLALCQAGVLLAQDQGCTTVCGCGKGIPKSRDTAPKLLVTETVMVDGRPVQQAILKNAIWPTGKKIVVEFLDEHNNTDAHDMVKRYSSQWTECANIAFVFVPPGRKPSDIGFSKSDIRIKFNNDGYHVVGGGLGKLVENIAQNRYTMSLDNLFNEPMDEQRRVCLHEFGHALGFQHEHLNPDGGIKWKQPDAMDYWKKRTGWSEGSIRHNVFRKLSEADHILGDFDSASIMIYSFPGSITENTNGAERTTRLSDGDTKWISTIYPPTYSPRLGVNVIVQAGQGVKVVEIDNDSPMNHCHKAGVQDTVFGIESGDTLLTINGKIISSIDDFQVAEKQLTRGDRFQFQVQDVNNSSVINRLTTQAR